MTHAAATKYMQKSKQFTTKWGNHCRKVKTVSASSNRGSVDVVWKKKGKMICAQISKNISPLSLCENDLKLPKTKKLKISHENVRRELLEKLGILKYFAKPASN